MKPTLHRPLRALVADDCTANRVLLDAILRHCACDATLVANGREALDALSDAEFDLVFMDLQMPEMNGRDAAAAIRARHPNLRIIAASAGLDDEMPDDLRAVGFDAGLPKPISVASVSALLEEVRASCAGQVTEQGRGNVPAAARP